MSMAPALPHAADVWWGVDEMATVPAVRRAATALATDLGFDGDRVGEVGIVVTELATNLVRHARGGELVLRTYAEGPRPSLRLLAIDSGPGSRNIAALISDGASTRGSLGIGLGACVRLSTSFDAYSVPALGTVVEATLAAETSTEMRSETRSETSPETSAHPVADLTRALSDNGPCGDTTAHRPARGGWVTMVADGLGHGPLAAEASRRAAEVLRASDALSPAATLERIHAALGGTRGAAISIIRYDRPTDTVWHAGVGNVVVRLVGASGMRSLPSQPGIVGHRMPRLRELSYSVGDAAVAVMHSDGLTQRWTLDDVPGVLSHSPAVVCAAVMRAAASRRDDASVLVLRTAA